MKLPTKIVEQALFRAGYEQIIGVDEVGMGCLAGPVVVCAVAFTPAFYQRNHVHLRRLRDSKLLQPRQREMYAKQLMTERGLVYALAQSSPKKIDKINIYQAARDAMRRAINRLPTRRRAMILVDGPTIIKGVSREQRAIVKGDRHVFAIACASVIAKVYRDNLMSRVARSYPAYGFEKHKGYGTKLHRQNIKEFGLCAIHRRSFHCGGE
jgi:ribonuclease HII